MLRSNKLRRSWWFGILCVAALGAQATRADLVEITVATNKAIYQLDENVLITVAAFNPTSDPITLMFPSGDIPASYWMDGVYDWEKDRSRVFWLAQVTIASQEERTWQLTHGAYERTQYPLVPGWHTVQGELVLLHPLVGAPVSFQVVPEPPAFLLILAGAGAMARVALR